MFIMLNFIEELLTYVPLSPSSRPITWYRSKSGCLATGEYRQNYGQCVGGR